MRLYNTDMGILNTDRNPKTIDVDQTGMVFINGKPFKGRISHWGKCRSEEPYSLGWYVIGIFIDHPIFKNKTGHTSDVLAVYPSPKGELIETRNSVYLLMEKKEWSGWSTDRSLGSGNTTTTEGHSLILVKSSGT